MEFWSQTLACSQGSRKYSSRLKSKNIFAFNRNYWNDICGFPNEDKHGGFGVLCRTALQQLRQPHRGTRRGLPWKSKFQRSATGVEGHDVCPALSSTCGWDSTSGRASTGPVTGGKVFPVCPVYSPKTSMCSLQLGSVSSLYYLEVFFIQWRKRISSWKYPADQNPLNPKSELFSDHPAAPRALGISVLLKWEHASFFSIVCKS